MSANGIGLLLGAGAQVLFAAFQAMVVIFSASSILDRRNPGPVMEKVVGSCIVVLPCIGLLTAGLLVYLAFKRPEPLSHLWHLVPVVAFAAYVMLAAWLMR